MGGGSSRVGFITPRTGLELKPIKEIKLKCVRHTTYMLIVNPHC